VRRLATVLVVLIALTAPICGCSLMTSPNGEIVYTAEEPRTEAATRAYFTALSAGDIQALEAAGEQGVVDVAAIRKALFGSIEATDVVVESSARVGSDSHVPAGVTPLGYTFGVDATVSYRDTSGTHRVRLLLYGLQPDGGGDLKVWATPVRFGGDELPEP